jgi:hypothetical protein
VSGYLIPPCSQVGNLANEDYVFYSGTELLITASGTVHETIAEGSYVKLQVKYGLITLITQTIDLCEQLGNVDLGCPVEPGVLTVTKSVDLPKAIPPVCLPPSGPIWPH